MTPDEAREQLAAWREAHDRRDEIVREALAAGLEKMEVHRLTGLGRATIDRIEERPAVVAGDGRG